MSAKVIQVIVTHLERRGSGKDASSPVRVIEQFWSLDGVMLAENDPCAVTTPIENASPNGCLERKGTDQ